MRKYWIGGAILVLLTVYQNCGTHTGAVIDDFSSYGKSCDAILMNAYRQTYYNAWFRSGDATHNCVPCHAAGGEAGPTRAFASADFANAFQSFNTIGRVRVQNNGVNANHKPPHTGSQNQSYISSASATWTAAEEAYKSCTGSNEVITSAKTLPANVYTASPADNAAWPTVSWDLDSDMAVASQNNQVHMTFTMEVRRFMDNTKTPPAAIGYQFRNPTIAVKAVNGTTPTYRIVGIAMNHNGANYTYMTAYTLMDVTVNSTTGVNIAANAAFAAAPTSSLTVSPADTFAMRFTSILDANGQPVTTPSTGGGGGPSTLPTRVSFAELNSNDATKGVFTRSCVGCHRAGNAAGNLDLTNYAASAAVASTIRARMNNVNNPMPTSGLLGANDRAMIDIWISSGTPQN